MFTTTSITLHFLLDCEQQSIMEKHHENHPSERSSSTINLSHILHCLAGINFAIFFFVMKKSTAAQTGKSKNRRR